MANCQKNSNYYILNSSGQQVRNIRLSADGKTLEIVLTISGNTECTFAINGALATGLQIVGDALQIVDPIGGLTNEVKSSASTASIKINQNAASRLEIIGIEDKIMQMQANIRFDAATNEVIMNY